MDRKYKVNYLNAKKSVSYENWRSAELEKCLLMFLRHVLSVSGRITRKEELYHMCLVILSWEVFKEFIWSNPLCPIRWLLQKLQVLLDISGSHLLSPALSFMSSAML